MKLPNEIEQAIKDKYSYQATFSKAVEGLCDPVAYPPTLESSISVAQFGARIALEHVRAVILGTKAQDYDECLASMCNDTYRNQGRAILRQELLTALGMTENEKC